MTDTFTYFSGRTLIAVYIQTDGSGNPASPPLAWDSHSSAWESWSDASYAAGYYAIAATETTHSGVYGVTRPAGVTSPFMLQVRASVDGTAAGDTILLEVSPQSASGGGGSWVSNLVSQPQIVAYFGTAPSYSWAIVDSAGNPVNLAGKTLTLCVWQTPDGGTTRATLFDVTPAVSGTGSNVVTATLTTADTQIIPQFPCWYNLANLTDNLPLASGPYSVVPAQRS